MHRSSSPLYIISLHLKKILILGRMFEVTANSPVGSPLQYDYWLSTNGAEPVKIAWQNIEHIAYDFTTEGKYRMFGGSRCSISL